MDTITDLVEYSYGTATDKGWHDNLKVGATPVTYPTTLQSGESVVTPDGMDPQVAKVSTDYVATKLMLACGELHEALEELRAGRQPTEVYWKHHEEGHEMPGTVDYPVEDIAAQGFKLEGFPIEIADCLIRLGDLCGLLGIDIKAALELKGEYNRTRPYRHGGKAA
jgi:hypothetical protein